MTALNRQLINFLDSQLRGDCAAELKVSEPRPIAGGSSKAIWAVDASWTERDGTPDSVELILRQDRASGVVDSDLADEHALLTALDGRLPVPVLRWADLDGTWFDGPTLIVERSPGRADRAVLRDKDPLGLGADGRLALARDLADLLADVHAVSPPDVLPDPGPDPARTELQRWESELDIEKLDPDARLQPARTWLHANLPPAPERQCLVHGDFRPANVLVDDGRITVLLDWELAHRGDPADDLGWYTCSIYRTEHFPEGWAVEDFLARYAERGATGPEPERLRFWQVLSVFRLTVIALRAARNAELGHTDGPAPPVDRVIGRLLADIG